MTLHHLVPIITIVTKVKCCRHQQAAYGTKDCCTSPSAGHPYLWNLLADPYCSHVRRSQ
ncbi:hypothetical protein BDA96_08G073400 [Sorghum bicolor]|uniref:Uncharacterized protein n=1 Tax=Sorghum bicolor TaxID=4558 RepID=A0A921QE47_SORBI|nr:hypothetical protein BDA96_08G073400 [Sorghum bicolor]KAG0520428.1 hypothetical protein BDA96_08G073400 [Sorghum bicolor]KAG0520429.1 hypothetical protein BDA96_08G073400 [Sorghum bicolor]